MSRVWHGRFVPRLTEHRSVSQQGLGKLQNELTSGHIQCVTCGMFPALVQAATAQLAMVVAPTVRSTSAAATAKGLLQYVEPNQPIVTQSQKAAAWHIAQRGKHCQCDFQLEK